jgi:quinohemoprotein ethanol dehydrogenase
LRWKADHNWLWNGGTMTTAGNLVFQGTADGWLSAYDASTGKRLWRFNTGLGIISQPISYSVHATQYVALLVGYGAPNPYNMPSMNPGWKFNAQPRRLLTFKLGGKATLPATAPPSLVVNALDDASLKLDSTQVAAGRKLFAACSGCHGGGAVSSGAPGPDLRESRIALDRNALYNVLHEGAFMPKGMPRFENFTREQVEQIYVYIRERARAARKDDAKHGTSEDSSGPS